MFGQISANTAMNEYLVMETGEPRVTRCDSGHIIPLDLETGVLLNSTKLLQSKVIDSQTVAKG